MPVSYQLATAPCSWGVDFADRPENPVWTRILDEAAAAGFTRVDLGPVGYFPTEVSVLDDALRLRGLGLSAGGLFDDLTDPDAFDGIIRKTRRTCKILSALDAPRLVIIDGVSADRGRTAGRSLAAKRLALAEWDAMIARIAEIARIALGDYGVRSSLHAHAGCHIEFDDELDRALNDLPHELVGVCIDTGHAAYAGADPIEQIRRYGDRIWHVHLKNIDPSVHAACLADGTDFFGAITRGVFCPVGAGAVDLTSIRDALAEVRYAGLAVVEQDVDPAGAASPLANARQSLAYLRSIGMA